MVGVKTRGHDPDMNNEEAARYLGISPTTLIAWRCTKRHVIPYRKLGRLIRYRQADLDTFLESTIVSGSAE